jgi:hypothetical protein
MDSMVMAFVFASALAISACVVLVFAASIDRVLVRVIPDEMDQAWGLYVKFALFVATFAGGVRPTDLSQLIGHPTPGETAAIGAGPAFLEVLKAMVGSLVTASGFLIVFFGGALLAQALIRAYKSHDLARAAAKTAAALQRPRPTPQPAQRPAAAHPAERASATVEKASAERAAEGTERRPVGQTRHTGPGGRHADIPL